MWGDDITIKITANNTFCGSDHETLRNLLNSSFGALYMRADIPRRAITINEAAHTQECFVDLPNEVETEQFAQALAKSVDTEVSARPNFAPYAGEDTNKIGVFLFNPLEDGTREIKIDNVTPGKAKYQITAELV